MAEEVYHGDNATIAIETTSGTSITVGTLQGVTVIPGFEIDTIWGADSVKWSNKIQRNLEVSVEASIAGWDTALLQQWLGGSGASSTGVVDTVSPAEFKVTGEVTPADGGTNLKAVVTRVVFPEMPMFAASKDEWLQKDLSGAGRDLTLTGP